MKIQEFFDEPTFTLTYLVYDPDSKDAVLIDPVWDYEPYSSTLSKESYKSVKKFIKNHELKLHYVLETHAHADHLTAAPLFKKDFPQAQTLIHENIQAVQQVFKDIFNFGDEFDTEGKVFDRLVKDGDEIQAGTLSFKVIHTPGHTPACVSYYFNQEAIFTGDALFMPDFGTGRCDFPKGSAKDLYNSVHNKLYKLPDDTKVYVGHDYQPNGRELQFQTTIGVEKKENIQLKEETSEAEFIKFREERDSGLMAPKLLLASIQVNAQNGALPKPDDNGVSYLKMPLRHKEEGS